MNKAELIEALADKAGVTKQSLQQQSRNLQSAQRKP